MFSIVMPKVPSEGDWERLAVRGAHRNMAATVHRRVDNASLREALSRRGFLDVVDGGQYGLELPLARACA